MGSHPRSGDRSWPEQGLDTLEGKWGGLSPDLPRARWPQGVLIIYK